MQAVHNSRKVLILILMEYSLRRVDVCIMNEFVQVLILILMEYSLRLSEVAKETGKPDLS